MDTVLPKTRTRSGPHNLSLAKVRNALEPRKEPYWGPPISQGHHLGLRRIDLRRASWIARRRPEGGIQEYHSLGWLAPDFGYDEAVRRAAEWFKEKDQGVTTSEVKTVADACHYYVTFQRDTKKRADTAHDAEKRFERTIYDDALGKVLLKNLRKQHIETWLDGQTLSPASLARTYTAVKAALNLTVKKEKASESIRKSWAGHELPEIPDNRRKLFLDIKQRRRLLKAAKGAVRNLIEAAILTGARAGELVNATRAQFEARTHTLTLNGKTGTRDITLSGAAMVLFKKLAEGKEPTDLLLTRDDGKQWAHSDWDELVRDAATAAKLASGTCLYTLRHSWITTALSSGMSTLEVARLCGTSLLMIEKNYGHLVSKETRKRLDKVAML